MISLSTSADVTLPAGSAIAFDVTNFHTGCGECHRQNSSIVKLRARGIYEISFHANISSPAAGTPLSLSVRLGNETLTGGTIVATPSTANALTSVAITIPVRNCCCDFDQITIVNTGSTGMTVGAGALLYIKRLS